MVASRMLKPAIIGSCLLLAIAFSSVAGATRIDPGTAKLVRGSAAGGDAEGGAGGRRRLEAVTSSAIHWCWGKTDTYNGWCHKDWDGVSTGAEPTCSYTNPDKQSCVPGTYLTACDGGQAALDYFLGFYGWGPSPAAVGKSIVQAMCGCNWCAARTAAAGLPAAMGWGDSPLFAAQTYGPALDKLQACCDAQSRMSPNVPGH